MGGRLLEGPTMVGRTTSDWKKGLGPPPLPYSAPYGWDFDGLPMRGWLAIAAAVIHFGCDHLTLM
jgi:hypothetical protein